MKQFFSLLLPIVTIFAVTSCSSPKGEDPDPSSSSGGTSNELDSSSSYLSEDSSSSTDSGGYVSSSSAHSSSSVASVSSSSVSGSSNSSASSSSSAVSVSSSSSRPSSSSSTAFVSSSSARSSSSVASVSSSSVNSSSSVTTSQVTTRSWTNVDYAPNASRRHSRQRYDIKLPSSGNGPFPLLIYVHGGGFSGGDWQLTQNNNGLVSRANSNGYAVASVGYLLMGQSGWSGGQRAFPENVEDVLAAVRHLRANAEEYHIDPDKFAISGFSAGAYMTAIVCALSNATNHGYDITSLGNAGVSHAVQAAASSAALTDFSLLETHEGINGNGMLDHNASPEGAMLGGNLTNNTESMRKYLTMQNPLTHIKATTPPIYMLHGTSDNLVSWQQSEIMVNKVNEFVPNKAVFNKVTGRSHEDFPAATNQITIAILNFLDEKLGVSR